MFRSTSFISFVALLLCFYSCRNESQIEKKGSYSRIQGKTMGTYYSISFDNAHGKLISKSEIDSVLIALNDQVSTYVDTSSISQYNNVQASYVVIPTSKSHFWKNFQASLSLEKASDGYFNHQIMPLVNFWGFGYTKRSETKDTTQLTELRKAVRDIQTFQNDTIYKTNPLVKFDFSALAKGYGVDLIGDFLVTKGVKNYLVDIGGESRAQGINSNGVNWTIGIQTPDEKAEMNDIHSVLMLKNKAIATSGNYRNFYEANNEKYVHTINPYSGYPEKSKLLSASIITNNCMVADGWATACMAMGLEKAIAKTTQMPELEAMFIYLDKKGNYGVHVTDGFKKTLVPTN